MDMKDFVFTNDTQLWPVASVKGMKSIFLIKLYGIVHLINSLYFPGSLILMCSVNLFSPGLFAGLI